MQQNSTEAPDVRSGVRCAFKKHTVWLAPLAPGYIFSAHLWFFKGPPLGLFPPPSHPLHCVPSSSLQLSSGPEEQQPLSYLHQIPPRPLLSGDPVSPPSGRKEPGCCLTPQAPPPSFISFGPTQALLAAAVPPCHPHVSPTDP